MIWRLIGALHVGQNVGLQMAVMILKRLFTGLCTDRKLVMTQVSYEGELNAGAKP